MVWHKLQRITLENVREFATDGGWADETEMCGDICVGLGRILDCCYTEFSDEPLVHDPGSGIYKPSVTVLSIVHGRGALVQVGGVITDPDTLWVTDDTFQEIY